MELLSNLLISLTHLFPGEPQAGAGLSRNSHDDFKGHVTGVRVTAQSEGKPLTKKLLWSLICTY